VFCRFRFFIRCIAPPYALVDAVCHIPVWMRDIPPCVHAFFVHVFVGDACRSFVPPSMYRHAAILLCHSVMLPAHALVHAVCRISARVADKSLVQEYLAHEKQPPP
jgi:hypothetical protein